MRSGALEDDFIPCYFVNKKPVRFKMAFPTPNIAPTQFMVLVFRPKGHFIHQQERDLMKLCFIFATLEHVFKFPLKSISADGR